MKACAHDHQAPYLRHPALSTAAGGVHSLSAADLGKQDPDQRRAVSPATGTGAVRLPGRQAHRPVHQRHDRPGHRAAGLRITGEVITTPYSFVATAHSLLWNGIKPVFVDIDPDTLNLDPARIEAAITPQTTAIMPVHVYGHPCDVDGIQKIADNYNLKVIYDAAHAFGVQDHGGSVLQPRRSIGAELSRHQGLQHL